MKIINNQDTRLIDEIKCLINSDSIVYFSCNYFTVYGIFELLPVLDSAKKVNVLLDIQSSPEEFKFIQSDAERPLNLYLDRKYRASQVIELINSKFDIREGHTANQNLLIIENGSESTCFTLTPLNMDLLALGTVSSSSSIFISSFEDAQNQYLAVFHNAWEKSTLKLNGTILNLLEQANRNISGQDIYKYSIREIFEYATLDERASDKLEKVGFKDSKVWNLLYNFQKDAVIGAIEKIETYGGCIIADSVGLGKTFEALAVMKYYQLRNDRILLLAPKKLRENWTVYQLNDKRNILSEDRLNYDVLNHTDLSREQGMSGDIDLAMINWGNYDLVVIDESHNFRNNPNKVEGTTRYQRLMNQIIKANIRTKVLMLSATPVNNKMNDLKNQIAFITEADDAAFEGYGINSVTQLMKETQRRFTKWFKSGDVDSLNVNHLMELLDGRYFKLLDMLTIARSRKHIVKYYDTSEIGKFPERLKPITVKPGIDTQNRFKDIGEIYDEISMLELASYSPLGYVRADKKEYYAEKYDQKTKTGSIFKQLDREKSLIYLMRVNLLKRLESSIYAFQITVENLIKIIDHNLKQIENHKSGDIDFDMNITDIDIDDSDLEDMLVGGKTKVLIQDIDIVKWKQNLNLDKDILIKLLGNIELIDAPRDAKLKELKGIITQKINNPINTDNNKIIIFTAFADTANYLYREIANWVRDEHGLYSALVTGSATNKTTMPGCKSDLLSILTNFSPASKKRDTIDSNEKNEIDILICTDVISEGQNLQDCDFLINYDIHWNPVRIIQRFGRIDRIGSTNDQIQLLNFYPSMELDRFIDLIARVQGRMVMLDVAATGEDNIISKNSGEMQDLEYRKKQLIQLQNQVIDIEDVEGSISITDMTFNDFKIDLEKSTDAELAELENIPPASFAVVESNLEHVKPGAIFCLKDNSNALSDKIQNNILYPYFLVYVSLDGTEIVKASQTKVALDYFRKLCTGTNAAVAALVETFNKETQNNKKMDAYAKLLRQSIREVVGVQEEVGLNSLATAGGTTLLSKSVNSNEDLELVSYLIIK